MRARMRGTSTSPCPCSSWHHAQPRNVRFTTAFAEASIQGRRFIATDSAERMLKSRRLMLWLAIVTDRAVHRAFLFVGMGLQCCHG